MFQRQRVLLFLLKTLHEADAYTRTKTDKLLFLLSKEYGFLEELRFYSFFPYKYGPFSGLFYHDMRSLERQGYIIEEKLTDKGLVEAVKLDEKYRSKVEDVSCRFPSLPRLRDYVYSRYPEYTIKSELLSRQGERNEPAFFSIGYEGKDLDAFLDVLIRNTVQVVADVRYNPFSMQFYYTRENLARQLKNVGIEYVHMQELGIAGRHRKGLDSASDYSRLFEMYKKDILDQEKLRRLIAIGATKRVAFMCMEKDHERCHRGVISSELQKLGYTVTHL